MSEKSQESVEITNVSAPEDAKKLAQYDRMIHTYGYVECLL